VSDYLACYNFWLIQKNDDFSKSIKRRISRGLSPLQPALRTNEGDLIAAPTLMHRLSYPCLGPNASIPTDRVPRLTHQRSVHKSLLHVDGLSD